jgi:hypothetical protein
VKSSFTRVGPAAPQRRSRSLCLPVRALARATRRVQGRNSGCWTERQRRRLRTDACIERAQPAATLHVSLACRTVGQASLEEAGEARRRTTAIHLGSRTLPGVCGLDRVVAVARLRLDRGEERVAALQLAASAGQRVDRAAALPRRTDVVGQVLAQARQRLKARVITAAGGASEQQGERVRAQERRAKSHVGDDDAPAEGCRVPPARPLRARAAAEHCNLPCMTAHAIRDAK